MKILGLDLGKSSCGIAISDPSMILASGVETYFFESEKYDILLEYLDNFIKKNRVSKIILGLPKNMDGSIGEQGKITLDFQNILIEKTGLEVVMWDERLTTKIALGSFMNTSNKKQKRKKNIDKVAAIVILQSYLDSKKG